MSLELIPLGSFVALFVVAFIVYSAVALRTVVPTNMVHTVQSRNGAMLYGNGSKRGNVSYAWPKWLVGAPCALARHWHFWPEH